jgi:hypothetical protein
MSLPVRRVSICIEPRRVFDEKTSDHVFLSVFSSHKLPCQRGQTRGGSRRRNRYRQRNGYRGKLNGYRKGSEYYDEIASIINSRPESLVCEPAFRTNWAIQSTAPYRVTQEVSCTLHQLCYYWVHSGTDWYGLFCMGESTTGSECVCDDLCIVVLYFCTSHVTQIGGICPYLVISERKNKKNIRFRSPRERSLPLSDKLTSCLLPRFL